MVPCLAAVVVHGYSCWDSRVNIILFKLVGDVEFFLQPGGFRQPFRNPLVPLITEPSRRPISLDFPFFAKMTMAPQCRQMIMLGVPHPISLILIILLLHATRL
jgi:hypothetical protein